MQTERREETYKFSKETTWEAVRASGIELIETPGADLAQVPLRVACAMRLAESPQGTTRVRIDYFIEALWSPSGGEPTWNDITSRDLRPEDDAAAIALFAETEEEGFVIDDAIEKLLRLDEGSLMVREPTGGVP